MKKFKKSSIIVPALARIAVTAAASVSGTVAWFTASRTATVSTNAMISTKTSSSLNVTVTGDSNSGTGSSEANNVVLDEGAKLTHGSYDAKADKSGSLYVADLDDDNQITAYRDLATVSNHIVNVSGTETNNKWKQDETTWYAFAWQLNFTFKATAKGETNYLLFDVNSSTYDDGTTNGQTKSGFRIAFMTGSKFLVVGGDDVKTHTIGTAKSGANPASFADANYATIEDTTAKLNDDDATLASSKFSFGELNSDGTTALTIQCVAWFEGSDPWIADKNGTTNIDYRSSITANLQFYTRAQHA